MKCLKRIRLKSDDINISYPISGVTAYGKGIMVNRIQKLKGERRGNTIRKKIGAVNQRSLSRLVFKVTTCGIQFKSMLTLTYGQNFPVNGQATKEDVNQIIVYMKRSFGKFSYFWFLEFQNRGAPHVHLVSTLPEPSYCERELLAELWSNIIEAGNWAYTAIQAPYNKRDAFFGMYTRDSVFRQHRREDTWQKIRKKDGAIRYAVKYASKMYQKRVPKDYRDVGRFWATSYDIEIPKGVEIPLNERELRELLATMGRDFSQWAVLPKFIFIN